MTLCKSLHKFAGVILKAGTSVNRLVVMRIRFDPKLIKFAKAAGMATRRLLVAVFFGWRSKTEAEQFCWKLKTVNAPLLFVDLETRFRRHTRAIEAIQELSSENWKQVFTYAGWSHYSKCVDRVDWYPGMGLKIITLTLLIHQYTESGRLLDLIWIFQRQKYL